MARILLVEDEAHVAEPLCDNLEAEGHEVLLARRGDAGLRRAEEERFDLVILDVMLPGLTGYEICQALRERLRRRFRLSRRTMRRIQVLSEASPRKPSRAWWIWS